MSLTVTFEEGQRIAVVNGPWQYDYGQTLEVSGITGLPELVPVHFAPENAAQTVTALGVFRGGILTVIIPDAMFLQAGAFWAYLYWTDGESGQTIKGVKISPYARPAPSDPQVPQVIDQFNELVNELNVLIASVMQTNDTAAASAAAAAQSEVNAGQSEQSALDSKNAAAGSANSAAGSAQAAAGSATAAAGSETSSKQSEQSAIGSKNAAAQSEANAAQSALSAAESAQAAAASETAAAESASEAHSDAQLVQQAVLSIENAQQSADNIYVLQCAPPLSALDEAIILAAPPLSEI